MPTGSVRLLGILTLCSCPHQIYHTYSHMWITPVQPWNFLMWSHENFNMQIRLKLCQIWRVEKFHTCFNPEIFTCDHTRILTCKLGWNCAKFGGLKNFTPANFRPEIFTPKTGLKFFTPKQAWNFSHLNRPEIFHT